MIDGVLRRNVVKLVECQGETSPVSLLLRGAVKSVRPDLAERWFWQRFGSTPNSKLFRSRAQTQIDDVD